MYVHVASSPGSPLCVCVIIANDDLLTHVGSKVITCNDYTCDEATVYVRGTEKCMHELHMAGIRNRPDCWLMFPVI